MSNELKHAFRRGQRCRRLTGIHFSGGVIASFDDHRDAAAFGNP